jgi:hypothetical protein
MAEPTELQLRGGTAVENDGFTGANKEVTVDTTNKALRVHDGATPGGNRTLMESDMPEGVEAFGTAAGQDMPEGVEAFGTAAGQDMPEGVEAFGTAAGSATEEVAALAQQARLYARLEWNSLTDSYNGVIGPTVTHENMRRCVMNDAGQVVYYLDTTDSTKKADGTTADLTGADGQVMVEIPKFWLFTEFTGALRIYHLSSVALPGYFLPPAFRDGAGDDVDYIYVGAYDACVQTSSGYKSGLNLDNSDSQLDGSSPSVTSNKLASVSGIYPLVGQTRAACRTLASNRGADWQQMDFDIWTVLRLLYLTEYGNWNGQFKIGDGNVNVTAGYPASSTTQSHSPHSVAGKSNAIGNGTDAVSSTVRDTAWMSYRGIENFWGNCWTWIDGINILDRQAYVSSNPAIYADDTVTGYGVLGTAAPASDGFIRDVQPLEFGFLPAAVGGTSSSHLADYYWQNTGWRVAAGGGHADSGAHAGPGAWAAHASSARYRSRGARLARRGQNV